MPCKNITNNSNLDLKPHQTLFDAFFPYSQEKLGYDKPFSLNFASDEENHKNPLGKTAHYNPSSYEVTIYTDGRHIKDILRSLSHELVHHAQNCRGEFGKELDTSPGYAQEDGHLRNMEKEAYLKGNLLFRDWEDNYKQTFMENKTMKKLHGIIRKVLKEELNKRKNLDEEKTEKLQESRAPTTGPRLKELVRKELRKVLSEQDWTSAYRPADDTKGDRSPYSPAMSMQSQTPAGAADLAVGKASEYEFEPMVIRGRVDPEVAELQAFLKYKGHSLGSSGPKRDGVDGVIGRKTRTAMAAEGLSGSRRKLNRLAKSGDAMIEIPGGIQYSAFGTDEDIAALYKSLGISAVKIAAAKKKRDVTIADYKQKLQAAGQERERKVAREPAIAPADPSEPVDWKQKLKDTPSAPGFDARRKFLKRNIKESREGFQESKADKDLQEGVQPSKKLPMYKIRDNKVFEILVEESTK